MAALSKRDIEMIFRAETDAAQRPVNALTGDIKKLRSGLDDLTKSSDKNEKSLADLANTTRELEQAQKELGTARTLVTQLNAQQTAVDRATDSMDKAQAKYDSLKKKMDDTAKPTKTLTNSFEAAERSVAANTARLAEAQKQFAEVKESIESIIGPVGNVQDAFRQIAVAQRDVTQGLTQAKEAASQFNREIATNSVAASESLKTEERTLEAQRKNDALAETARKQKQREEIDRILQGNAELERQFAELAEAEKKAAQVDAFRQMAAESVSAQSAVERIADTTNNATTATQRLAQAVLDLANPAKSAAATLDGMAAKLEEVEKTLAGGKLTQSEWGALSNDLANVQANLLKVASAVDAYQGQEAKLASVSAEYEAQRTRVLALTTAQETADKSVTDLTAELAREEKALKALGVELDREILKLKEMGNALENQGVNMDNLPKAIQQIEATARRAAPAVEKVSNAVTPGKNKGFLGLNPNDLRNLSYQVNDVFTSLASGISPMQTLAQQGGQITQLFPGLIGSFVAWLPVIVPVAAALGVVAAAMAQVSEQAANLKAANTVLAALGNTNGWDTSKYTAAIEAFRQIGVSADQANAAVKTFATEGLNPASVDDFIVASKNLADVQGIDVKTAAEEVTKAFTGGADAVLDLDNKYHFLTDAQREQLIASKDTKDEHEEVNKAFTALYNKMQDGAQFMNGPGKQATVAFKNAWHDLLATIGAPEAWTSAQNYIANTLLGLTQIINIGKRVASVFKDLDTSNSVKAIASAKSVYDNFNKAGGVSGILDSATKDTQAQYNASRRALTAPRQNNADPGAGSRGRQTQTEKDEADQRKKDAAAAKKAQRDADAAAKKRAAEAAALEKQYENEQDQLSASLNRATAQALANTQAPLDAQIKNARQAVDEQFKALEDRLADFKAKFGAKATINGMSQSDYAAQLEAQKEQIKNSKTLGVYEENINDLIKSRDTRLSAINDDQKSGLLTAQQALDKTKEVTSELGPQIDAAIDSARTFIASLKPSAETTALLDKFDKAQRSSSGPTADQTAVRSSAKTSLESEMQKTNQIMQTRTALIEAANNAYEEGTINFTEKEKMIKDAYDGTNTALKAQIDAIRAFLTANKDLFTPETYQLALSQLDEYNSKLKYTSTLTTQVKSAAQDAIASGLTNMFDTLAQGIANVITGAGSLKDLFSDLGKSVLNFAASFAKAIADAIVKLAALRVAKSIIGAFHGGGTVGSYANGQMKLSRNLGAPDLSAVPRYHTGTESAGLKSNETLAVLEKGEKVQTEEQQKAEARKLKNAGGTAGSLKQVLAFGDDQIAAGMQGDSGENVVLTHLRRNVPLLKQWLK